MRINKYLAMCGIGSRRKCEEIILDGKVKLNGNTIIELSTQVDPQNDTVTIDDRVVSPYEKKIYIILNKPKGYLSTSHDPQDRKKARDLIPLKERLFSVGRLDFDSEGLLLFTNDGDLAYKLSHPKFNFNKKYVVFVNKMLSDEQKEQFENGITLSEGVTSKAVLKFVSEENKKVKYMVTIHQGWKRQIRRMFAALDIKVFYLRRVQFGAIKIGDLEIGKYRYLTDEEVDKLKKI